MARRPSGPRRPPTSISRPARNSSIPSPRSLSTVIGASICTQPRTDGPITIPAITSSTAPGTGSAGSRPSTTGTNTATAAMTRTPLNEIAMKAPLARQPASITDIHARVKRRPDPPNPPDMASPGSASADVAGQSTAPGGAGSPEVIARLSCSATSPGRDNVANVSRSAGSSGSVARGSRPGLVERRRPAGEKFHRVVRGGAGFGAVGGGISRISFLLSTHPRLRAPRQVVGGAAITWINSLSHPARRRGFPGCRNGDRIPVRRSARSAER